MNKEQITIKTEQNELYQLKTMKEFESYYKDSWINKGKKDEEALRNLFRSRKKTQ